MKRNRNGDNLTPSASSPAAATALEVELNRLWEKLLLSLVGESIGEPCVVGAGVSVREHENCEQTTGSPNVTQPSVMCQHVSITS